jgi:hypothetical protein
MSDANTSSVAFQRETTWGVLPVSPALKLQRHTGESIIHAKDTVVSEEIRSDRQTADMVEVGSNASGGMNFELSYTDFQHWMEAALFNTIQTLSIVGLTASGVASTQVITAAAASFTAVQVGSYVKITGFTNPLNNGVKLVLAKANDGTTITLAAGSLAADQAGATIGLSGKFLTNGTTRHSYLLERGIRNSSGTPVFQTYAGMCVDQMALTFESKKIITGSFTFMGKKGETSADSAMAATAVAATGTLTFSGTVTNNQTVTIGSRTYTFKTALSSGPTVANEVLIGADAVASRNNLVAAVNAAAGVGTTYSTGTLVHADVTAVAVSTDAITLTAAVAGVAGNSIVTTDTVTNAAFGAATLTGGTAATAYTAASVDPVLNATSNVGTIFRDGVQMQERFKTLNLTVTNGLRGRDAIGEQGNFDIGVGSFGVSGSMNAYFRDNSLLESFINHDDTSVAFSVTSGTGAVIGICIPRIKLASGSPPITGKDTDVMIGVDFQAIIDSVTQKTMVLSFIDA